MYDFSAVWEVKKNFVTETVKNKKRMDGRGFEDYRKVEVEKNPIPRAEGSALARIGDTQVLVGVKFDILTPYPDAPDEGVMMTGSELVPVANPEFEPGRPGEDAIELARIVDRAIRESQCIDFSGLCIEKGEKVWGVLIDIHTLNDDGNLIDASSLAAVAALLNTRIPKYEDEKIVHGEYTGELKLKNIPISTSFCKIADTLMVDPVLAEERTFEAGMTIGSTEEDIFCSSQKRGTGSFTPKEVERMLDLSLKNAKELRKAAKG